MDSEVKEGFICPMCMKDLGTQLLLQSHFVDVHAIIDDGDPTKAQNIKGIFDKAKRKFLGKSDDGIEQTAWGKREEMQMTTSQREIDFSYWEPQDIGFCRNLTREFRKTRSQTIDDGMIEINTILIRLEKMLKVSADVKDSRLSGNSSKKAKERSLVPWIADSDAKVCFGCQKSFTVARRKHHCRLCGQVICGKCSEFLPLTFAATLCKLDGVQDLSIDIDDAEADEHNALRICCTCYESLLKNYEFKKEKQKKIPLVQLYERITILMSDADLLLPDFNKMAESLSFGDTRYPYQQVVNTRMKLLKMYETLELLSKKVIALGSVNTEDGSNGSANQWKQSQKVHRGIHTFVTNYLQYNMFTLKSIPSEEEFASLQAERSTLLRKRAEREKAQQEKAMKERAMMHKEVLRKGRDSKESSPLVTRRRISGNQEEQKSLINNQSDTLLEQINNVKEFIRKAKENGELEEVQSLERNLNELQSEYNRRTKRY